MLRKSARFCGYSTVHILYTRYEEHHIRQCSGMSLFAHFKKI